MTIRGSETAETSNEAIFVCMRTEKAEEPPLKVFVRTLPAGLHAKFSAKTGELDWEKTFGEWLPASGYRNRCHVLECFSEGPYSDEDLDESVTDMHIPIQKEE